MKILQKIYNYFKEDSVIKYGMAIQINTVAQILAKLNTGLSAPQWSEVPGVFALTTVNASLPQIPTFNPNGGVIVKVFLNSHTGEIKTYLAKYLDKEGRNIP